MLNKLRPPHYRLQFTFISTKQENRDEQRVKNKKYMVVHNYAIVEIDTALYEQYNFTCIRTRVDFDYYAKWETIHRGAI